MGHPHRHGRIPQPVTPTPHASRGPTKTHRTTTRTHHSVMTHTGHPATAGSPPDCRRNWGQHEHRSFAYCTVLLTYHDRWSAGGLSRWAWTMSECSAGGAQQLDIGRTAAALAAEDTETARSVVGGRLFCHQVDGPHTTPVWRPARAPTGRSEHSQRPAALGGARGHVDASATVWVSRRHTTIS